MERGWGGRIYTVARWSFVPVVLGCIVVGLRESGTDLQSALLEVSPWYVVWATLLVSVGLILTSLVWWSLLSWLGARAPWRVAGRIFFLGQLGKYVPGSVWNVAAQSVMGSRVRLPPRTVAVVSLTFLWLHVATGLLVGALALIASSSLVTVPADLGWVLPPLGVLGAGMCSPHAVVTFVRLILRRPDLQRPSFLQWGALLLAMTLAWLAYGAALLLVAPGLTTDALVMATGAYALAYAVGVVVIVAPAGAGAREVALGLLLEPTVGLAAASAGALLARVCHTIADLMLAAVAWAAGFPSRTTVSERD